jgi:hypothetical protein
MMKILVSQQYRAWQDFTDLQLTRINTDVKGYSLNAVAELKVNMNYISNVNC